MEKVDQAINALLALFASAADAVLAGLAAVEQWLRTQLTGLGVAPQIQTVIMIAVAILLLLLVLRMFGGIIRDFVCNEVPLLLRDSRPYATCAFAGCVL